MVKRDIRELRKQAARRRRRLIFNCDAGNINPQECPVADPEVFLQARYTGLLGSSVDTIFCCTDLGFSNYSHHSSVSSTACDWAPTIGEFIEQGTDTLQMTVEFCRRNDIEVFWSFRTNDPHDSWTEEGPLSQFKKEHPEYLFGTRDKKPGHGQWTCVDYAQPEVREHVFQILQDVCSRYDIDGIELDYFRMMTCFKSLAQPEILSEDERDAMTELLRRVRTMADEIGAQRGRPLLIAARLADSAGYCHAMGLDLMRWLEEDLIDIMVAGGYFWLQPWRLSVELGHEYGVPVYPCLSGSRVASWPPMQSKDPELQCLRECLVTRLTDEAFQAQALSAWDAGADGVYLFNFNYRRPPSHRLWTDLGDPEKLATLDKIYHVSVMGKGHDSYEHYLPFGRGERFAHLPVLSPDYPQELLGGRPLTTALAVADDLPAAAAEGLVPELRLNIQLQNPPSPEALSVQMNGRVLTACPLTWTLPQVETGSFRKPLAAVRFEDAVWLEFTIDPQTLRKGDNCLEIALTSRTDYSRPCVLRDVHLRINYRSTS